MLMPVLRGTPPGTHVQNQQMQQMKSMNQTPQSNKGQQSQGRGRVNHVSTETAQENPQVVLGYLILELLIRLYLLNLWPSIAYPCVP
jgi:hypothetical protein